MAKSIIIIGAGVIGLCATYYCAEALTKPGAEVMQLKSLELKRQ